MAVAALAALAGVASVWAAQPTPGEAEPAPLAGEEAERFLRQGRVIHKESLSVGVTRPRRVTLSDGRRTARGVWKNVDIYRPFYRFADGSAEFGFRDSYKHEIAAYELDKLLGLGMVPPTVERRLDHEPGSLQLWIEDSMTETERRERGVELPDVERWNEQIYTLRLIRQLLDDSDFNNISNVLVDADFRVWAIDNSRGFRLGKQLPSADDLQRFSRSALRGLRELEAEATRRRLRPWLTAKQIQTLLIRRDLILERAELLIAERGEAAVLFP